MATHEHLLHVIQGEFRHLVEHQPTGREARNLAAQFGTDRTAGTRHQHHFAGQHAVQSRLVELHLIATEEVFKLDFAHLGNRHTTRQQVIEGRHGQHGETGITRHLGDMAAQRMRRGGYCQNGMADSMLARLGDNLVERTEHRHAVQQPALLFRIVVEQADDMPLTARREFAQQSHRRRTGAEHQHRLAGDRAQAEQMAVFPGAVEKAAATHEQHQENREQDQHRTRHVSHDLQHVEQQRNHQRTRGAGHDDALEIGQAGEAPDAAIQAELPGDEALQRHHRQQRGEHAGHIEWRHLEIEAQPVGQHPGQSDGRQIMEDDKKRTQNGFP